VRGVKEKPPVARSWLCAAGMRWRIPDPPAAHWKRYARNAAGITPCYPLKRIVAEGRSRGVRRLPGFQQEKVPP